MKSLTALTSLFLKQLVRRKSLWIVIIVFAGMMLINYMVQSQMEKALNEGLSYDIATKRAASALESFARTIRTYSVYLILIVSALVAPASRKDGTSQFILTLSVSRLRLALSQYAALCVFVVVSVIIVHTGYVVPASRLGIVSLKEAALAWVFLLAPLLVYSAVVFSLSLAYPAIVTYIVFIAVPQILLPLAEAGIKELAAYTPMALVRWVNNVKLLFPDVGSLILWPKLTLGLTPKEPPFPQWSWLIVHAIFASLFWIALGFWFYRNYDFGSRTATK